MLLIFDMDGTIVDTKEEIFELFREGFRNMGLQLDEEALERNIGLPLRELLKELLGEYREDVEREIRRIYFSRRERKIRVFPGMMPVIQIDSHRKAILTSKKRDPAMYDLEYLNIAHHFHAVLGADDVERNKPSGEGILKIMEILECRDKNNVLMIGDTEMDILAAKDAGVKSVAVTWGFRSEEFLKRYEPDYIVRRPDELLNLL